MTLDKRLAEETGQRIYEAMDAFRRLLAAADMTPDEIRACGCDDNMASMRDAAEFCDDLASDLPDYEIGDEG